MSLGQMATLKAVTIKPRSLRGCPTVCATLIILEKEFSSVIHKYIKIVPGLTPRHDPELFYFGSTPTIDIEPKYHALFLLHPVWQLPYVSNLSYCLIGSYPSGAFLGFLNYSLGPASTRALPASLPVYLTKFLMNRPARSSAFFSHSATSA